MISFVSGLASKNTSCRSSDHIIQRSVLPDDGPFLLIRSWWCQECIIFLDCKSKAVCPSIIAVKSSARSLAREWITWKLFSWAIERTKNIPIERAHLIPIEKTDHLCRKANLSLWITAGRPVHPWIAMKFFFCGSGGIYFNLPLLNGNKKSIIHISKLISSTLKFFAISNQSHCHRACIVLVWSVSP